jgi:hypothetical protein
MTCHLNDYGYGHAGCCGCKRDIDLASETSALCCQQGNMLLYFFYCSGCASRLRAAGEGAFAIAIKEILEEAVAAFPSRTGFAMTTSLALRAHGGDLVKAYEVGVLLPRVLHDAIAEGEAEAAFLPPLCGEVGQ